MNTLLRWLDQAPLGLLVFLAVWMLAAPIVPEPHLWEKAKMLMAGTLTRPIDIFDVLFHLAPVTLLGVRLARRRKATRL